MNNEVEEKKPKTEKLWSCKSKGDDGFQNRI